MRPITAEWIAKAEADFATAVRESRVRKKLTMTVSVFIVSSVLKNILKPVYVKRIFLLVRFTT